MDIAAHAYSVRTTMLSLYSLKISYVFIYKISITLLKILICLGKSITQSNAKILKNSRINETKAFLIFLFYYILRFTISILFSAYSLLLRCCLHSVFL